MTNFFLEELRKIYGDGRVIHDPQFVGECYYQKMRGMSYQEVLRTNGQISFPEVLRQQKRL